MRAQSHGADDLPEGLGQCRQRRAAGGGQCMGDGIGVDQQRALGHQHGGAGALAAADAAGQGEVKRHQRVGNHKRVSVWPKNIAAMPPPTR